MPRRRLYSRPLDGKVNNATVYYVDGEEVEPGLILFVTTASLEDETNAPTTMGFGKKEGGGYIPLEEWAAPTAGIRKNVDKTHQFTAGEKPSIRVEGGTLNDIIRAYLEGYYEEV